jgi:hypothetical protein
MIIRLLNPSIVLPVAVPIITLLLPVASAEPELDPIAIFPDPVEY